VEPSGFGPPESDGEPTNWIREFRKYHRDDKGSGKIVKHDDHLMDATRYLIISGRHRMHTKPQPPGQHPGPHAAVRCGCEAAAAEARAGTGFATTSRRVSDTKEGRVGKIERMSSEDVSGTFSAFVGATLVAVTFVMDYVQLQFDAAQLTAYTPPQVQTADHRWTSEDPGWRDSLCARIGVVVRRASCSSGQALQIDFEDGVAFTISLMDEDYRGPEAFTLSVPGHNLIVA
jgi:hypothetical protein